MKLKTYKRWTLLSAFIWAIFAALAYYAEYELGTIATLGGIALMFAWMYEDKKIEG